MISGDDERMDESRLPPSAFTNPLYGNEQMLYSCLEKPTSPRPILFDRLRILAGVPHSIPGL
jgi:hypothetical protein